MRIAPIRLQGESETTERNDDHLCAPLIAAP
jgi:hypothetical protein